MYVRVFNSFPPLMSDFLAYNHKHLDIINKTNKFEWYVVIQLHVYCLIYIIQLRVNASYVNRADNERQRCSTLMRPVARFVIAGLLQI